MDVLDEKATAAAEETHPSKPSSLNAASVKDESDNNSADPGKADTGMSDEQYPHGFKLVVLAGASLIAVFLIALDQTIVGTWTQKHRQTAFGRSHKSTAAIPKITDEFHSLADVSWYAAAYFMTFGASQTAAGKIYKYYNLKWSFLISMIIFEVGSLICGVASSSNMLIAGRAIAGLGGAGLSVGGTSIVSFTVRPKQRPMMMGIIGMTYCLAAVLGPLLGGVFSDSVTWRWCFYINLPIGGAATMAVLFFFHLPAAGAPPKVVWWKKLLHTDPIGVALVMGGITCFILALQYGGNTHPWNSSIVIGLLVGFGLLMATLVGWEIWQGEYAMMLPRLYKQRSLTTAAAFQFFFMGSYIVILYYLPIYFQSILGASPIKSGVDILPLVLAAALFALAGGAVVMKTGRAQQVMLVGSMGSTVALGLIYTLNIGTSTGKWIGYQILLGAFMAFAIMHGLTLAQAYVGPEDLAATTANLLFFQTVGGAFSSASGQAAFLNRLLATLPHTAPSVSPRDVLLTGASELKKAFGPEVLPGVLEAYMTGLKTAFAVSLAFCGVAFLCSLAIPMRKLPSHVQGETAVASA